MRLVEVAKKLGMTGQQLRKELSEVDFGVKPTDREVPEKLAQGIIRFVARKYGIEVVESEPEQQEQKKESSEEDAEGSESDESAATPQVSADPDQTSQLHILRKLTLEDVPKAAVQAQRMHLQTAKKRKPAGGQRRVFRKKRGEATGHQEQIKRKEGMIELPETISVKEFAEKTGVQVPEIIAELMKNGMLVSINQTIDFETAAIVAADLGLEVRKAQASASLEELLSGNLEALLKEDNPSALLPRPPVVTVMGHVDHGKTAILDAIRKTDVVSGEAGGITQRIGAYQVEHTQAGSGIRPITFLDTPGHEAFTAMRARGAQITDVVVLVVAADEGVKPTTVEAINHAKDAGVPILVALNKIDKPNADAERVKGELAQHGLQPEEWGGTVPIVSCSAVTGQGINDLLDHILLIADLAELKANPDRRAVATVIEGHLDSSHGPVASLVLNTGTLHVGDIFVCGGTTGKVKVMMDAHDTRMQSVGPSGAVRIAGLSAVPESGDILQVVSSDQEAKKMLSQVLSARESSRNRGLKDLVSRLSEGKLATLKIVLKADSQGSLEAIHRSITALKVEEGVAPKVIHAAVGDVNEGDVMMAAASSGIVLGFAVDISSHTERVAEREGVQVRMHDVIYNLLDEVQLLVKGLIEPEEEEKTLGHLAVLARFYLKNSDQIVGGRVTDGVMKRLPFRLQRDGSVVSNGRITSVKLNEKDIKEAKEGTECGLKVDCSEPIQEGDIIEVYLKEWKKSA